MSNSIKLHLGCGKRILPGFVHIDLCDLPHIDYRSKVNDLSMYENERVDLIYASHLLEYYDRVEVKTVLAEWRRVLKPSGILRLAVPDFDSLIEVYMKFRDLEKILGPLYGRWVIENTDTQIYHKTVYNFDSLKQTLEENGFSNVHRYDWRRTPPHDQVDDYSQAYVPHMDKENGILISLNVEAERL